MEKTLSEQLADNLTYFVNDTSKRCVDRLGSCFYSGESIKHTGKDTEGCFVGRLLTPKDRITADKLLDGIAEGEIAVYGLVRHADEIGITIPKIILDNLPVMSKFQFLHDTIDFWNDKGLSERGKALLATIIKDYDLEEKYFEKFLAE